MLSTSESKRTGAGMLTKTERQFNRKMIQDYYPETYERIYGETIHGMKPIADARLKNQVMVRQSGPTRKELKMHAKDLKIRCFNAMEFEELRECIKAKENNDGEAVLKIEATARERIKIRMEYFTTKKEAV